MNDQDPEIIRPYTIDGIEEFDNPLPPWWVRLFQACILFGFLYLIWIHGLNRNQLQSELRSDQQAFAQMQQKNLQAGAEGESLADRLKKPELQVEGKALYAINCAPCHGQAGEGIVGPNLTDAFWLHGESAESIVQTITDGVPAQGMIAWGNILGPKKIESVAAFILSLKGSNPPNAKAPQGEEFKP